MMVNHTTPFAVHCFLQGLHIPALVMLHGVRAIVVMPLQDDILAAVLIQTLGLAAGVGSMEVRRLAADLGGTGGGGEGDGQGCGQNCGHADMDGIFPGHRLILFGFGCPNFLLRTTNEGSGCGLLDEHRMKVNGS